MEIQRSDTVLQQLGPSTLVLQTQSRPLRIPDNHIVAKLGTGYSAHLSDWQHGIDIITAWMGAPVPIPG